MRCRNKTKNKKEKDEEEEERYNKTKLSKLGRSVFEATIHELTISLWETPRIIRNANIHTVISTEESEEIHSDISRILKKRVFSTDIHQKL